MELPLHTQEQVAQKQARTGYPAEPAQSVSYTVGHTVGGKIIEWGYVIQWMHWGMGLGLGIGGSSVVLRPLCDMGWGKLRQLTAG
jgi:hypothetical protein